jgi:acyl-CoA thioester hydrolase
VDKGRRVVSQNVSTAATGWEGFVWETRIFFDDLDPMGMLHNSRYLVLIERAESSFHSSQGRQWQLDVSLNPDQHYAIREQMIRYLQPVRGNVPVAVHMWLDAIGRTSATFGFEIRSMDGLHAIANRMIVKLDPHSFRPVPWTDAIRAAYTLISRPTNSPADAAIAR